MLAAVGKPALTDDGRVRSKTNVTATDSSGNGTSAAQAVKLKPAS